MPITTILLAATTAADSTTTGGWEQYASFLIFIPLIAIFYFFMIRPQRKRDKELKAQVSKMSVGDEVITIGGLVGTIANISDDEVTISTSVANTMVKFKKSSISTIIPRQ